MASCHWGGQRAACPWPWLQLALSTCSVTPARPSKARAPAHHKPSCFGEKSPPGFLGTNLLGVHLCRPSSQHPRRPDFSSGFELLFTPCSKRTQRSTTRSTCPGSPQHPGALQHPWWPKLAEGQAGAQHEQGIHRSTWRHLAVYHTHTVKLMDERAGTGSL